jgi:surfeit locus 1 family protein
MGSAVFRIISFVPMNQRLPAGRTVLALAAGVLVTVITVALGSWQTRRGDLKEAIQARWNAAENVAPVELRTEDDVVGVGSALPRRVTLRGEFIAAATVFVDNRTLDGAAGFQVITPLRLAGGTSVLIDRGWLPRDLRDPSRHPALTTPTGEVTIDGIAVARVPHLLELASLPLPALPGIWPNLEFEDFERVSRLPVARLIVQQSSDAGDGLRRVRARPATDVEKHRGYALQWYSLAVLSAALTLYFGGGALRRGGRR